jgi:hypothetical protein
MTSPEFLERAKAAVAKAVREQEAKGIQPVYFDRKTGQIVGGTDDASREDRACEGRRVPDILKREDQDTGVKK